MLIIVVQMNRLKIDPLVVNPYILEIFEKQQLAKYRKLEKMFQSSATFDVKSTER